MRYLVSIYGDLLTPVTFKYFFKYFVMSTTPNCMVEYWEDHFGRTLERVIVLLLRYCCLKYETAVPEQYRHLGTLACGKRRGAG